MEDLFRLLVFTITRLLLQDTHLQLTQVWPPAGVHKLEPVAFGEVSQVGDEGRDEEHVPTQSPFLLLEVFHSLCPADILRGQASHLKHQDR